MVFSHWPIGHPANGHQFVLHGKRLLEAIVHELVQSLDVTLANDCINNCSRCSVQRFHPMHSRCSNRREKHVEFLTARRHRQRAGISHRLKKKTHGIHQAWLKTTREPGYYRKKALAWSYRGILSIIQWCHARSSYWSDRTVLDTVFHSHLWLYPWCTIIHHCIPYYCCLLVPIIYG